MPHTILAPVYFMENLFNPLNLPALRAGRYPSPIPVRAPLQQMAVPDLLAFAALVIEQPDAFARQRIPLASHELNAVEAASPLSRIIGRSLEPEQVSADEIAPGLHALFAWLEQVGHHVDTRALHHQYPEVGWHSFSGWAHTQRSRLRGLCSHREPAAMAETRSNPIDVAGRSGAAASDASRLSAG